MEPGLHKYTYLVLQPFNSSPSTHNERIVGSDHGDDIDALGLELVVLLEVGREVVDVASGL